MRRDGENGLSDYNLVTYGAMASLGQAGGIAGCRNGFVSNSEVTVIFRNDYLSYDNLAAYGAMASLGQAGGIAGRRNGLVGNGGMIAFLNEGCFGCVTYITYSC